VNADVSVRNDYGQTVLTGVTDNGGRVSGVVTYHYESQNQTDSLKTSFNPFILTASKGGDVRSNNGFTVTWTAVGGTDTLDLASTIGTGEWGTITQPQDTVPPAQTINLNTN